MSEKYGEVQFHLRFILVSVTTHKIHKS